MVHASPLEYALVGLLKQKPQSGYDLRRSIISSPMRHFSDSPGSIYPALRRLHARKWLTVSRDNNGRKRQLFRVSEAGTRAFLGWLQQPVTREDVIWGMEEVFMRFAFQGGNVSREITRLLLDQLESELAAYLRELRAYAKESGLAKSTSTGGLAFSAGVKGYESQLAWTRRTRKIMEASL